MCVHMAFGLFSSVRFALLFFFFFFYLRIWFRFLFIGFTELYVCLNVGDLASGQVC